MAKDNAISFNDISDDDLTSLVDIFKSLSLTLSSFISSEFKLKFQLAYDEHNCKQFQDISFSESPAIYNELQWFSKPALLFAERSFFSRLANRILGGDGIEESSENAEDWFFSEECMASEFVDLVMDYLKTHQQPITFEKSVKDIDYLHMFYPEDILLLINFKIKFDGEDSGTMGIIINESIIKDYLNPPKNNDNNKAHTILTTEDTKTNTSHDDHPDQPSSDEPETSELD